MTMKTMNRHKLAGAMLLPLALAACQTAQVDAPAKPASAPWVADLGNGQYKNPVLHADYSDPDAIRVGVRILSLIHI